MYKYKEAAALSYEAGKDSTPMVIASGRGYIAEKIIKLARENDIPLFEDEETAHMLCNIPVGVEIPSELYQAVAEIYAFILKVGYEGSKESKLNENTK